METNGIFLPYGEGAELAYNMEMFDTSYAVNTLEYFIQQKGITNPSDYYYWFKIGDAL